MTNGQKEGQNAGTDKVAQVASRPFIIRKSGIVLALRLIGLELIFSLIYTFLLIPSIFITNPDLQSLVTSLSLLIFALIILGKLAFTIMLVLRWINNFYEVRPQEKSLIHHQGIFTNIEDAVSLETVQEFTVKQGVLGRYFHYGDIVLFSPALKKQITLYQIGQPTKYVELLKGVKQISGKAGFTPI
jgi:membrane protein YdbS with pleckstrin-like domain